MSYQDSIRQRARPHGFSRGRLFVVVIAFLFVGCPWALDNAYDPLRCTASCQQGELCYNGKCVVCLPDHLGDHTCVGEGFFGGTIKCSADGTLDTSGCTGGCGNQTINGDEQCDGPALGGLTCESLSYEGGTLSCQADCTYNTAKCAKHVLITVAAGQFAMGSPADEVCRAETETQHQVKLARSYSVMRNEVTIDQFKNVMGYVPEEPSKCEGVNCPVHGVTWSEAASYCNRLSSKESLNPCYSCSGTNAAVTCAEAPDYAGDAVFACDGYRLPTEAEWENAYRAGTTTSLHYGYLGTCEGGDTVLDAVAWYRHNSGDATHPVGTKWANDWGLYDMAGNVSEWCHDWAKDDLGPQPATNPWGEVTGTMRAIRGGSAFDESRFARAASRAQADPASRPKGTGFRCIRGVSGCGDSKIQAGEDCDGQQLDGKSCLGLGFSSGALGCKADCSFDTSNCALELVSVSAGTFTMGSPESELCRLSTETEHIVTLTHDFEIMPRETTQKSFVAAMGYNGAGSPECGLDCPVDYISWHQAAAYCNALSGLKGYAQCYSCAGDESSVRCSTLSAYEAAKIYDCEGFRLPTEAEWEFAYRAGAKTAFYNGPITSCSSSDINGDQIGWNYDNSGVKLQIGGQKTPNALGLYDLAGNVWEWCHDDHIDDLGSAAASDPVGVGNPAERTLRGGSYYFYVESTRAAFREGRDPVSWYYAAGVRCVRSK